MTILATAKSKINGNVASRFGISADSVPTSAQLTASKNFRQKVIDLATFIEINIPDGRNKSLALTHLEDALMRGNKGIYQD